MTRGLKPERYAQDTAERALTLAMQAVTALGEGFEPGVAPGVVPIEDGETFAIDSEHNGAVLFVDQEGALELLLPEIYDEDGQVTLIGILEAGATFGGDGASTRVPSDSRILGGPGRLSTAFMLYRGGVWYVSTPEPPDTVTVVYDAGWPAARPDAGYVRAVGHTEAPSWLTGVDVWEEALPDPV